MEMINSLREAFEYRGCPVCLMVDEGELDFMCHFQGKAFREEKARQDLVSSNGFCNFHFHEMARLTSPLVNAVLTKDLIDKEVKEIEGGSHSLPGRRECPVCRFSGEREGFYLLEFITMLQEKSWQREYEHTDGLCRIHTIKVLNMLGENELAQFLRQTQLMHLRKLRAELQAFIDQGGKNSRAMGKEKNSWWVAIQKWVGKKGLPE
jgi:hypothetical protein